MILPEKDKEKVLAEMHKICCQIKDLYKKFYSLKVARGKLSNDAGTESFDKWIYVALIKEGEETSMVKIPLLTRSTELDNTDYKNNNPQGYFATNDRVDKEVADIKDPDATFIMENNHVKAAFEKKKDREWFTRIDEDGNEIKVEKVLSENDLTDELKANYDEAYDSYVKSAVLTSGSGKDVVLTFTRNNGETFSVTIKDDDIVTSEEDVHITNLGFDKDTGKLTATVMSYDDELGKVIETTISTTLDGRYSLLGHKHPISDIVNLETELQAIKDKDKAQDIRIEQEHDLIVENQNNIDRLFDGLETKVDKVEGMGLSHNDLTDERMEHYDTAYDNMLLDGSVEKADGDNAYILKIKRQDGSFLTIPFDKLLNDDDVQEAIKSITFTKEDGLIHVVKNNGDESTVSLDGRYSLLNHRHSIDEIDSLQASLNAINGLIKSNDTKINTKVDDIKQATDEKIQNLGDNKVDKVPGKELSDNNYSDEEKNKVKEANDAIIVSGTVQGENNKIIKLQKKDGTTIDIPFVDLDDQVLLNTFLESVDYRLPVSDEGPVTLEFRLNDMKTAYSIDLSTYLARKKHEHEIDDIDGLQNELDKITENINDVQVHFPLINTALLNQSNDINELEDKTATNTTNITNNEKNIKELKDAVDKLKTDTSGDIEGINELLEKKVDKEEGKGLSTNDYTDEDKAKVDTIGDNDIASGELQIVENGDTHVKEAHLILKTKDDGLINIPLDGLQLDDNFVSKVELLTDNNKQILKFTFENSNVQEVDITDIFALNSHKHKIDDIEGLKDVINNVTKIENDIKDANSNIEELKKSNHIWMLEQEAFNITEAIVKRFDEGKNPDNDEAIYLMSFVQTSDKPTKFTAAGDYTLVQVDGTDTLKGKGSSATIVIYRNTAYLRIANKIE